MNNKQSHVTNVKQKVKKRRKNLKKARQSTSQNMADKLKDTHQITEEAKNMMSQLHIVTIENTIAETRWGLG